MTADEIRVALRRNAKARTRAAKRVEAEYDELRKLVREGKQRRLTVTEMAEAAGVDRARIYENLRHTRGPRLAEASTYDTLRKERT